MLEDPALSCLLCKIFLNLSTLVRGTPSVVATLQQLVVYRIIIIIIIITTTTINHHHHQGELLDGLEWAEDEEQAAIPFLDRISEDEKDLHVVCTKLAIMLNDCAEQ